MFGKIKLPLHRISKGICSEDFFPDKNKMIEREREREREREEDEARQSERESVCMNEGKKEEIERECVHECDYAVD